MRNVDTSSMLVSIRIALVVVIVIGLGLTDECR